MLAGVQVLRRLGSMAAAVAIVGVLGPTTATAAPRPFDSVASGGAIIAEAAKYAGIPYRYGATGPGAYDCSGYTRQVFRQFRIELPRTSGEQRAATTPIAAAARQPGDLVFFLSAGGRVTHLGIYAGGNAMWVAPSSGKRVMRQNIYSSRVVYGRVHS
ncbi:MAG: NlpC/P60 family protein [Mycobacteriales bacterium]